MDLILKIFWLCLPFVVLKNDKHHRIQVAIIAETMQNKGPFCFIRDEERVFVQGDARIARLEFIEQCNSLGTVQKSRFHSLFSCGL